MKHDGNVQDTGSHSGADEDRSLMEYGVVQSYIPYQRRQYSSSRGEFVLILTFWQ